MKDEKFEAEAEAEAEAEVVVVEGEEEMPMRAVTICEGEDGSFVLLDAHKMGNAKIPMDHISMAALLGAALINVQAGYTVARMMNGMLNTRVSKKDIVGLDGNRLST